MYIHLHLSSLFSSMLANSPNLKDLINCSRNSKTKAKQCIIDVVVGLVFYKRSRSHSHTECHIHENAEDDAPFAWPCSLTLVL